MTRPSRGGEAPMVWNGRNGEDSRLAGYVGPVLLILLLALVGAGCASTRNTVEKRKQERYGVYTQLSPDIKALVDQGQIKVGMPMDAVYIAWGKPSQVVAAGSPGGEMVTWIYAGAYLQEYSYWGRRHYYSRHGSFSTPSLEHDYVPQNYVSAEVIFQNNVVREWRTLPHPE